MNLKTTASVKRIGIIVLALIVVIGSMLVVYPFLTQNAKLAQDIKTAQAAQDDVQGKLAQMNNLKATNAQVKQLDDDLSKKFPATADTPGFAAFVGKAAADAGLSMANITDLTTTIPTLSSAGAPAAPAPSPTPGSSASAAPKDTSTAPAPATGASNLAEMNVTITAMGPIDQLQAFIANLKNGPRNLLISTYSVQQGGASTNGITTTATVSGKTYIYRAIQTPPADGATPATPATLSAPATTPTP
jgi:Tfp pilus assembly protein PilO